ncbi:MAG: hypothetical protein V4661_13650 [Pseudomonadota bacterium]
MNLTFLRDRLSAPLEWTAKQIALRPKGALAVWVASLVIAVWVF